MSGHTKETRQIAVANMSDEELVLMYEENERLRAMLAWLENYDPELVECARNKFPVNEQDT